MKRETCLALIALSSGGTININLIQDNKESISVEAEDNILPYLNTEAVNNQLIIGLKYKESKKYLSKNLRLNINKPINVNINFKRLKSITLSGSNSLNTELIKSPELSINTSGSSKINANISVNKLTLKSAGSSRINISGRADIQNLKLSGSVKYLASNLKSKIANVKAFGSSLIDLGQVDIVNKISLDQLKLSNNF